MDSPPFKFPPTPSMPLFPLSPERVNTRAAQSNNGQGVPSSPSMPELGRPKHMQSNSEVQAMVSRFNSLEINDHAELHKRDAAALKRAQMGREEAETELQRCREEARQLRKGIDEGNGRERKVMKRLDVVMEDLHRQKETQSSAQTLYEREIRRARKEAFKSSSSLVKLQEDLKSTRASLSVSRTDLGTERGRARQRDQDAFAAQYELVGVQEDLAKEREKGKVLESERDALKCQLKEEEVARMAAEGLIALPSSTPQGAVSQEDDEFASPRKRRTPAQTPRAQSQDASRHRLEMETLRDELIRLCKSRDAAEGQVEFMKMECQFQCCSCRVAEQKGDAFIHDASLAQQVQRLRPHAQSHDIGDPPAYEDMAMDEPPASDAKALSHPATPAPASPIDEDHNEIDSQQQPAEKDDIFFSPESGTFRSNSTNAQYEPRTEEQRTALRSLDSTLVTTSRPTVYINANGNAHEEEHQPGHRRHGSRDSEVKHAGDDVAQSSVTEASPAENHDTAGISQNPNAFLTESAGSPGITNSTPNPDSDFEQEHENEHASHVNDDEEDDDDDIFTALQESPTAHIQATTKTTTIPLAPLLSSPTKAPSSTTTTATPRRQKPVSRPTTPVSSSVHHTGTGVDNDKAQAPPTPVAASHLPVPTEPTTPLPVLATSDPAHDAANDNPWTPFTASKTLTREEAIERIRARRGRERARTETGANTVSTSHGDAGTAGAANKGAGLTPKRAASHGEGLGVRSRSRSVKRVEEGRRDVSAPERGGWR